MPPSPPRAPGRRRSRGVGAARAYTPTMAARTFGLVSPMWSGSAGAPRPVRSRCQPHRPLGDGDELRHRGAAAGCLGTLAPEALWPFEGVLDAIEKGQVGDRIAQRLQPQFLEP